MAGNVASPQPPTEPQATAAPSPAGGGAGPVPPGAGARPARPEANGIPAAPEQPARGTEGAPDARKSKQKPAGSGAKEGDREEKTSGLVVVRPSETGWEAGSVKRNAGVFPVQRVSQEPIAEERELGGNAGLVVALPTHQVLAIPLWLATDDTSLFADMVQLQLEKRALTQAPPPAHRLQIRTVVKEPGRTLVLVLLLAEPCPDELLATGARGFEPAPLTYPVAEDMLAFWKEQGQVVMAYRRAGQLAYLHAFTHSEVNASFTAELTCVLLPLMQDAVMLNLKRVAAWGSFSREELNLLTEALEFPVQLAERPGILLPGESTPLIPDAVVFRREAERKASRMRRISLLLGGIYALFLAFVLGQFGLLLFRVRQTQAAVATSAPIVEKLESTRSTWLAMESSIDPQFFVVELLLQSALPLPPSGVRLTLFQAETGSILIRGEARSYREAQAYYQELSQRESLAGYKWELGEQKLLANGSATFQITGKSGYAANDQ